jgi:two-component system, NtrC family, nitrogen regulation sensor histidine kinase NtrY
LQNIRKVKRNLVFSAILLITALTLDSLFSSTIYNNLLVKRFQERFIQVENELELRLDNIINLLDDQPLETVFSKKVREFRDLAQEREIFIYIYRNDSLLLWSDNRIVESEILPFIAGDRQMVQLSNCWCYSISKKIKDYKVIGLLLIKNNYNIKNQYLESTFNPVFNINEKVNIKSSTIREQYVIYNNKNENIFSINFSPSTEYDFLNLTIVIICFLASVFFILKAYRRFVLLSSTGLKRLKNLFYSGTFLVILYALMRFTHFPAFLFDISIFKLSCINFLKINLSLGDLFVFSLLTYISFFIAYTEIQFDFAGKLKFNFSKDLIRIAAVLILSVYFFEYNNLFERIVYKIDLSFDVAELFDNGYAYLVAIVSAAMLFAIFIFLADFIYRTFFKSVSSLKTATITLIVISLIDFIYSLRSNTFDWQIPIILLLSISVIIYLRNLKHANYKYVHVVLVVVMFSVYSVIVIYAVSERKLQDDKRKLAKELSSEHDQVAEYLVVDLGNKMSFDTTLRQMALKENIDFPWIYKYIRKKYFAGYWDRYDLQVTICKPNDSVLISPDNYFHPCFPFFNNLIESKAEQINKTNFYFLKNSNGRISYLSSISFFSLDQKSIVYLQLDSRLNTDALGYPQLLINQEQKKPRKLRNYSYAKYFREKIAYQSGSFLYNSSSTKYPVFASQFYEDNFGGFDHLFYKPDKDNLIILSKPALRLFDFMVSFSYLFIISFVLLNIMLLTANPEKYSLRISTGFKTRIRLSVISVLLLSLLTVAGITIYYIIDQYTNRHNDLMGEKLQSIYLEMENNLAEETRLSYIWKNDEHNNLESLLRHLSNLFSTDINIYSPNGRMIASSRPEIFDKGLSGTYMNTMAYYQMTRNNKIEFIQNEWLGNQKYSSIYTPFVNYQGNVIAYINLPYFTKQSALSDEISTMLMAIINFYIILALVSLSVAVVLSENITKPLKVIQESIARMKIGSGNEKIIYKGRDEIADLIDEYNRKVDELERSVELLSKSERELAWREMAKQVAHEIKNPLTPMKLSIQQLQRSWNDKHEFMGNYFERVTQTLIEQIDNLSSIATEFSSFAQMPDTKNEKIDIQKLISHVLELFNNTNIEFSLFTEQNNDYYVCADREQMTRVLLNLITNSIQAIPENKPGKIDISLNLANNNIEISIYDNGSGIPEELVYKLFQPNFTTKSSGSGLGLAICKKIIENAGGTISYRPGEISGSIFLVVLPKLIG